MKGSQDKKYGAGTLDIFTCFWWWDFNYWEAKGITVMGVGGEEHTLGCRTLVDGTLEEE